MQRNHDRWALLASVASSVLIFFCGGTANAAAFNVFIESSGNGNVYEVPTAFGGAGVGAGQLFASGYSTPYSMTTDGANIYVGQLNGSIFAKAVTSVTPGTGAAFGSVGSTTYDITFADSGNLHAVGASGTVGTVLNSVGTVIGTDSFTNPSSGPYTDGIEYVAGTGLYISHGNSIELVSGSGTSYNTTVTPAGLAADNFAAPEFLQQLVKASNGKLYATSFTSGGGKTIYQIDPNSGTTTSLFASPGTLGSFTGVNPTGIELGLDNRLYFADYQNGRVFSMNLDGSDPQLLATGLDHPTSLAIALAPEPTALGLMGMGAIGMLGRRKSRR